MDVDYPSKKRVADTFLYLIENLLSNVNSLYNIYNIEKKIIGLR